MLAHASPQSGYSHRLPSVLYTTGNSVLAGFEAQSKWKKGRLWETIFPSAKSELGAPESLASAAAWSCAGPQYQRAHRTATRTPATQDKLPPPKYPGGMRAASFRCGSAPSPPRLRLRGTVRTHAAPDSSLTLGWPTPSGVASRPVPLAQQSLPLR